MVRRAALVAALVAAGCGWELPAKIPCATNDNCPSQLGCNLTAQVCVNVAGCGGDSGQSCFSGSPMAPSVSASGAGASLTWYAGNTPYNASGFAVLRAEAQAGPFAVVGIVTPYSTQQSSFTDPGPLGGGKTYWYAIATSWPDNVIGALGPATALAVPHWMARASMPTGRFALGAAVVNGVIYAAGGNNQQNVAVTAMEAYDSATGTWVAKAPLPTALAYLTAVAVGGVVYAIDYSIVEAYDPASNTWSSKAPMPTARYDLAAGVINGLVYAVGGTTSNGGSLATVEAYDPATNSWTAKASMPTARGGVAAGVVNGVLYVVGGSSSLGNVGTVEAYDPRTNSWTTKAPMPTPRTGLAAGVLGGLVYALGGTSSGTVVEAYDPASDTWTPRDPMSVVRSHPAAAVAGGALFAIGGAPFGGPWNSVEAYTP